MPELDQHLVGSPELSSGRQIPRPLTAAVLVAALAFTGAFTKQEISADNAAAQSSAQIEPVIPQELAGQVNTLTTSVAEAWLAHQLPDGNLLDPVEGRVGGYGLSMIGQSMVQTGAATGNETLIQNGLQAELLEVNKPSSGVFEALSLAGAYSWNEAHLGADPNWQTAKQTIAQFLETQGQPTSSVGTEACYSDTRCWDNKKLVGALAQIELQGTGLAGQPAATASSHQAGVTSEVNKLIKQAAVNTGADAHRLGSGMRFGEAGILSDPSRSPLAYHQLSAMMLGHVVEALGSRTPAPVDAAFQRSARAIIGLMAPDGDGAYIGRGQGQVWNVAAMTDALAIAANNTPDPVWRGRFLAGAAQTLTRLQTVYAPGAWGMPLTPRLAGDANPNYLGIDEYANTVEYNGLALWELQDAAQQLQTAQPAPQEGVGADGVFIDPSHTQFATVKKGDRWWAIHAGDTAPDARYDFGLVAAERLVNGSWIPAIPYRPLTGSKTSGGPVLVVGGERLVPVGKKITAGVGGVVTIKGGWADAPNGKPRLGKDTKWVFKPIGSSAVNLSFQPTGHGERTYQFQTWYEAGSNVTVTRKGLAVQEPNGRRESYVLNRPVTITQGPVYHSAYDENLDSSILTVHAKAGKRVSYTTSF
jgi:hypothetical protein